jgi:hypothetical protein
MILSDNSYNRNRLIGTATFIHRAERDRENPRDSQKTDTDRT